MDITEVRMRRVDGGGRIRAVASLTFDDCFVVHEIKLVEGHERQIVLSMPSRKLPGGEHLDIAHPINSTTRHYIEEELVEVYQAAVAEGRREYRAVMGRSTD